MLAPIIGYSIKGAVWYQGETNAQKPENYEKLLRVLIDDWRLKWNRKDCPFLLVQLPNFMEPLHSPAAKKWAAIREAQRRALAVPGTAMTVNIDIGDHYDVHPTNKKELGYRLALAAEKTVYGEKNVVAFGPMFQSAKRDGTRMIIAFSDIGSGLITKDGNKPGHFSIAGSDKKYVLADAAIEGNCVAVWNDQIKDPCYVRYAWADDPAGANLYNKEGLPASPFTTE
jgi:sialate O-acetylesterase